MVDKLITAVFMTWYKILFPITLLVYYANAATVSKSILEESKINEFLYANVSREDLRLCLEVVVTETNWYVRSSARVYLVLISS